MSLLTKKALVKVIDNAQTYEEYKNACIALDKVVGNNTWKENPKSPLYDYELIQHRLDAIKSARLNNDIQTLISIIFEGLHGNLGGMGNAELYQVCHIGTKYLIEEFYEEIKLSLEAIYLDEVNLNLLEKVEFFDRLSQAYGQTALILSGAGGLGFFHCGLIKTLLEQDLLPSVISGSSAGALFAALVGTRSKEEALSELTPEKIQEGFGNIFNISMPFNGSLFDPTELENSIIRLFDLMTFQEAYLKTGIEINISISPLDQNVRPRLLNHISARNVIISTAVKASAALPYAYPPVQLYAVTPEKNIRPYIANRKFVDGSIALDIPIKQLSRIYGVNHTIVSQTNPLVIPFLPRSEKLKNSGISIVTDYLKQHIRHSSVFGCNAIEKIMPTNKAKLVIHKTRSVLEQSYLGDINIIPKRALENITKVFSNPTVESVEKQMKEAERTVWPLISKIETTTKICRAIKLYRHKLRLEIKEKYVINPTEKKEKVENSKTV